jgi:hypothetical protein
MNRNNPPFHVARRAAPPLSIPVAPSPMRTQTPRRGLPPFQVTTRRPCGFCAKVRKMLGLGP